MPTVIKADAGHDFLALLPRLTGYQPENSVVLVAFRGKRTCGAIRFDLPPASTTLAAQRRLATSMIGMLCKIPEVDAVVPVVYTADAFGGGAEVPQASFIDVLVHRAELAGFLVRDALCVAADGWASCLDPDTPAGGHPLAEIAASAVNDIPAAMELTVRPGVAHGTELPAVGLARRERVAHLLEEFCRGERDRPAVGLVVPVDERGSDRVDLALPDLLEHVLPIAPDELDDGVLAELAWCFGRPALRDIAIIHWAFGQEIGQQALGEQLRYSATGELDVGGTGLLLWGEGPRPDPERIEAAIELLRTIASSVPERMRPASFGMLAWFCWALGQSSRAAVFVRLALAIDSGYGLAQLIGAMLDGGRLPEWAFEVPPVEKGMVRYADAPRRAS